MRTRISLAINVHLSNICTLAGNGLSFTTFVNTVPINEGRTINRFALIRNLDLPVASGAGNAVFNMGAWDKFAHDAMIKCVHCSVSQ